MRSDAVPCRERKLEIGDVSCWLDVFSKWNPLIFKSKII